MLDSQYLPEDGHPTTTTQTETKKMTKKVHICLYRNRLRDKLRQSTPTHLFDITMMVIQYIILAIFTLSHIHVHILSHIHVVLDSRY